MLLTNCCGRRLRNIASRHRSTARVISSAGLANTERRVTCIRTAPGFVRKALRAVKGVHAGWLKANSAPQPGEHRRKSLPNEAKTLRFRAARSRSFCSSSIAAANASDPRGSASAAVIFSVADGHWPIEPGGTPHRFGRAGGPKLDPAAGAGERVFPSPDSIQKGGVRRE